MSTPSAAAGPTITCEKCHQGTMVAERVPRMGQGLNIIGFTLVIPSLLLLLGSTACGVLMGGASGNAATQSIHEARVRAGSELLDIREVPRAAAEGFESTGHMDEATLAAMSTDARERAERVITRYNASISGAAIGTGLATGVAGFGVIASYVIGLPFLIVGLLLIRKKNVWKCPTCQYVFDRA
ncbi:MAG: hypothetical protein AB7N65_12895 [Vicinamibacterales bacterium]